MDIKRDIIPFSYSIDIINEFITEPDNHIIRKLSSMKGQYQDEKSYNIMLGSNDCILYEVYEKLVPEIEGELIQGMSIVYPGKVGDEYFMTKGHFHLLKNTAEVYICVKGHGYMLMENSDGGWAAEEMRPNVAVYVPGGWSHRSVNTSPDQKLVTVFIYPANAGHDYATIESKGFRKIILDRNNRAEIMDNPRWI